MRKVIPTKQGRLVPAQTAPAWDKEDVASHLTL